MLRTILTACAALAAALAIRAEHWGPHRQVYLFKPLTVVLIILIALPAERGAPGVYQLLIVAGLLFSLAGDVLLMLPRDRFVAGLLSFLGAHLCYVAAFASDGGLVLSEWAGAVLAAYGALMLSRLWPRLGSLKGPVAAYVAVILLMAWLALSRYLGARPPGSGLAAAGALLFAASDSLLAWNRFVRGLPAAQALILTTYFAAQWLIARST